jgi:hypothetical protein
MITRHVADFARPHVARAQAASDARRITSPAIRSLLIAAVAACSAAALAGCEEQSYPTPSVEQAPPPAPPPPAALMGAPTPPPPYAPCAETPCGSTAPTAQPMLAPRVIASRPVPNPPETEAHRRHTRLWLNSEAQPVAPHHNVGQHYNDGRWHVVGPVASAHHQVAAAPAPVVAPPHHQTAASKPHAAAAPHKAAASVATVAAPSPPAGHAITNITDNATGAASGADADRYNSLQSALSNLIGVDAALTTPDHFQADQTVDVSLTLPANFAQQAHDEASKAGLADAAGSVNIDAHLTGTGFTIVPDQTQAQPLLLGQPTVFHWKVTPTAAAVGAVKADLTADLLTVGRSLPLGSVQSQAAINSIHLSGRLIGVGLLILVLVIVAGWLVSRTGKTPTFRRRDI